MAEDGVGWHGFQIKKQTQIETDKHEHSPVRKPGIIIKVCPTWEA